MADPCMQERVIGKLESENKALIRALESIEANQREFISLLQQIAGQREQISTLFTNDARHDKADNDFGARIRDLELAPGQQASQLQIYGITAIISAIIGYVFKRFV